jgi:hypothetical protein
MVPTVSAAGRSRIGAIGWARFALARRRRYYPSAVQSLASGADIRSTVVASVSIVCVTLLAALGKVDSATVVAIFTLILGGVVGHAEGYAKARAEQNGEPPASS